MIRVLAGCALLLAWAPVVVAQQPRTGADAARTFQALAISPSPVLAELFYMRGPNEGVPLDVSTHRLSPTPMVAGSGPLVLAVKRADAQGKQTFVPVAQAEWPQGGGVNRALLFVAVNGSGRDTKVQVIAMDNSLAAFPMRSVRVINLSGRPLLGQYGDFRGELPTGPAKAVAYPAVKPPTNGGVGRFPVAIGQRAAQGESMKVLFNGWTEAWPEARTLLLVVPGANPERPQVRFLVDAPRNEPPRVAGANGRS